MKRPRIALLVCLVLSTTACPSPERAREPAADTAALAPPRDGGAVPEVAQTISLQPAPGAQIAAEAVVLPIGVETRVTFTVHQAPANVTILGHLRSGSCDEPGPVVADLQPITTDRAGVAESRIVVGVPFGIVASGNHIVQLVQETEGADQVVACGEVPRGQHLLPPARATPP